MSIVDRLFQFRDYIMDEHPYMIACLGMAKDMLIVILLLYVGYQIIM